MPQLYICDLRPEWRGNPYVTFWRPDNAGYAYPLPWAGRYSDETVDADPTYYWKPRFHAKRALDRFPVICEVVEAIATDPEPGLIDGDAGPVVPMNAETLRHLRLNKWRPRTLTPELEAKIRCLETAQ